MEEQQQRPQCMCLSFLYDCGVMPVFAWAINNAWSSGIVPVIGHCAIFTGGGRPSKNFDTMRRLFVCFHSKGTEMLQLQI